MKQIFQSLSDGKTEVVDIPLPKVGSGMLLVRTSCSLISSGTERMLLEFGKSNVINKIKKQPNKVKDVYQKFVTDGIISTLNSVKNKIENPIPLGYSNCGVVIEVGEKVEGFSVGDRVISNGPHAEFVQVSQNLCAKIPNNVTDEEAVFTVLGSIALQGTRLSKPTFGESFVIIGLGLVGILTAKILLSQGCKVFGFDISKKSCDLAKSHNIDAIQLSEDFNPLNWSKENSEGYGIDAVIITAATSSNSPIDLAANICRKRGRIILIGDTGLKLNREEFYKKELFFQVSCSYGPGRYDKQYEQKGIDYPNAYVRWTEQRNFKSFLYALDKKLFSTNNLISHEFYIDDASKAYELLLSSEYNKGILLKYRNNKSVINISKSVTLKSVSNKTKENNSLSLIGSGNYASSLLLPAFKKSGAKFETLVSKNNFTASNLGRKFKFQKVSTDKDIIFKNKLSKALIIATRHDSHASLVLDAINSHKHVFVEKPLCLKTQELQKIEKSYRQDTILMVGFNRRFAPLVKKLKFFIDKYSGPKAFIYKCNAGYLPKEHWLNDLDIGGGRLIGEACHFVDLLRYLSGSNILNISCSRMNNKSKINDTFSINLSFKNGSIGTIHYFANGSRLFPKEMLEVFWDGKVMQLDNFKRLNAWGLPRFKNIRNFRLDKGQENCCKSFLEAIKNNSESPIPFDEIIEVHKVLLNLNKS